jgi:hypothetical protein
VVLEEIAPREQARPDGYGIARVSNIDGESLHVGDYTGRGAVPGRLCARRSSA